MAEIDVQFSAISILYTAIVYSIRYFLNIAVKVNGMKVSFVELAGKDGARNLESFVKKCSVADKPKMVWIESPTNPMLKVKIHSFTRNLLYPLSIPL